MDNLKITDENYEMYNELYNSKTILKISEKEIKKIIKTNVVLIPVVIFIIILAILKFQEVFMLIYTPTFLLVPGVNFIMLNNIYKRQKEDIKTKYQGLNLEVSITELENILKRYKENKKDREYEVVKIPKTEITPIMPKVVEDFAIQTKDKNKVKSKKRDKSES